MEQNDVRINIDELESLKNELSKCCLDIFYANETNKVCSYTCISEVVDKYAEIYTQVCTLLSNYRQLLIGDLSALSKTIKSIKKADLEIAFKMNNSHLIGRD